MFWTQEQVGSLAPPKRTMTILCLFICWMVLFAVCWPLALLALVLLPFLWLLSIPFRILFACVEGLLHLIRAILLLPAKLLGGR